MRSRVSISVVGLLVLGAVLICRSARADVPPAPDDPVAWLAGRSEIEAYDRIAVLAGDAGRGAGWARDAVVRVLAAAGHEVATLSGESVGNDRQKLTAACRGFDALAIVRNSTDGAKPTVAVTLYDPRGDLVAAFDGQGLPPPAWPPRELAATVAPPVPAAPRVALGREATRLEGPAFYEAMGRPDLASRYRRRRAAKIAVLAAGGGVAVAGLALTLGDILVTNIDNWLNCTSVGISYPFPWFASSEPTSTPTCQRENVSPWPLVLIGVGLATAMVGAVMRSTRSPRRSGARCSRPRARRATRSRSAAARQVS